MSWEELKEKSKKMGYYLCYNYNDIQGLGNYDRRNLFSFYSNSTITFNGTVVASMVGTEQMYQIMETIHDHLCKSFKRNGEKND